MNWKVLVVISLLGYGAYQQWQSRYVTYGPGVIAPIAPQQSNVSGAYHLSSFNDYQITPLAKFNVSARVLSTKTYNFGREAQLSPIDFALGWGRMSDEAILSQIKISQSGRFYFWHVNNFPIPREEIETQSANMHMVPVNSAIEKNLKDVRVGQVVNLQGYLIEAKAADGWHWKSSLSREDTGNGSCELMMVEHISVR